MNLTMDCDVETSEGPAITGPVMDPLVHRRGRGGISQPTGKLLTARLFGKVTAGEKRVG